MSGSEVACPLKCGTRRGELVGPLTKRHPGIGAPPIALARPLNPGRPTSPPFADAKGRSQMARDLSPNGGPHHFLFKTSCNIARPSVRSATSRFSFTFSSSSCLRRRISGPPSRRTASSNDRSSVPKRPSSGRSPRPACRSPPAVGRRRSAHSCIDCVAWHPSSMRLRMPENCTTTGPVSRVRTMSLKRSGLHASDHESERSSREPATCSQNCLETGIQADTSEANRACNLLDAALRPLSASAERMRI